MTPLQKGMLKEYKKNVCIGSALAVIYFFLFWDDTGLRRYLFLAPIILPIFLVYIYYMKNRIKEENEKTSIRKDMLQIFIVCFLFSTVVFAILMHNYWSSWLNWCFYVVYCILMSALSSYSYYNDLKKKKKKEQEMKENPPS